MRRILPVPAIRKGLALLIVFTLIFPTPLPAVASAHGIVADGRTLTTIETPQPDVINVTTGTIIGGVAGLNSFTAFNVASQETVNLFLPSGTSHLLNLVHGELSQIDGVVNSIKDGGIGGNVYFLNPHGIVVGASGSINVGSFHAYTPQASFMDSFFGPSREASVVAVLEGRVPVSASGSIVIEGTVNAVGDITLSAGSIENRGAVLSGAVFQGTAPYFTDVVNLNGLESGGGLAVENGTIRIVAAKDVISSGAIVADGGAGVDAGSIEIRAGESIRLEDGAVVSALGHGGSADGDISIVAEAADDLHVERTDAAGAVTRVTIGDATVRGKDVTIRAEAKADHSWSADDPFDPLITAGGAFSSYLTGLQAAVAKADAEATVVLESGARVEASGNVAINAASTARAGLNSISFSSGKVVTLSFAYGGVGAKSTVDVQDGASIRAAALDIGATNTAELDLSVSGVTASDSANAVPVLVVSGADVAAKAAIAKGASIDVSGEVQIAATNSSSFSVSASTSALGAGVVGMAAAIFDGSTQAEAQLGADLAGASGVKVVALDDVTKNSVSASAGIKTDMLPSIVSKLVGSDRLAQVSSALKRVIDTLPDLDGESGAAGKPKLAGALSFVDASHGAKAWIADGTSVSTAGDVSVIAQVQDAGIKNSATSSVSVTAEDDEDGSVALSAAISYGKHDHQASAFVGDNSVIRAQRVGIRADTVVPYEITWHKWDGISTITSKLNSLAGLPDGFLSGWANATGSGEDVNIAGSVVYRDVTTDAGAYLGKGASIIVTGAGDDAWSTALSDDRSVEWGSAVAVVANSDVAGVYAAGNISLLTPGGVGDDGDEAAAGASYAHVNYTTRARAGILEGAVITHAPGVLPVNVTVSATSKESAIVIAPSAGLGAGFGVNGVFALSNIKSETQASIDDEATVDAASLEVTASDDVISWAVTGAVTKSESVGVGVSIAVNRVETNTAAFIGDNDGWRMDGSVVDAPAGTIRAGGVSVNARTDGVIESISVGMAMASNEDPDPSAEPDWKTKLINKLKGVLDRALGLGNKESQITPEEAKGVSESLQDAGDKSQKPQSLRPSEGLDAGGSGQEMPRFGIGISGSASANSVSLNTAAYVKDVTVRLEGNDASIAVGAVNDTNIGAFSGSGALARANNSSTNFSAGVAGSVAVNQLANSTTAAIEGATITGAANTDVYALSGGEYLAVALGVSVNASAKQDHSATAAGSVSVTLAHNTVSAQIAQSEVTGAQDEARRGDLGVVAYDRTRIGTGGGAFLGGGKTGVGAAVTYAEIGNSTSAAIQSTTVSRFRGASVEALSAALIAAGGAMGAVLPHSDSRSLSGAFVITQIENETSAKIAGSQVTVDGDLLVAAQDTAGVADLDAIIDNRDCTGPDCPELVAFLDYKPAEIMADESMIDTAEDAARDAAEGADEAAGGDVGAARRVGVGSGSGGSRGTGSSIIAAAGVVGVGGQNVGISSVWNEVSNTYEASIVDSPVTAGGAVTVDAASEALIVGVAAGVGVAGKFAGAGSVSVNQIANRLSAQVGATGAGISIDAGSLQVRAADRSEIDSVAGGATVGKGSAAAGVTVAFSGVNNDVHASIAGVDVKTDGETAVEATNDAAIRTFSVALAASGGEGTSVAGSIALAEIGNTTRAELASERGNAIEAGRVAVRGDDRSYILTVAGGLSGSGNNAVGGAAAVNWITNETRARLAGVSVRSSGAVDVKAGNDSQMWAASVSGGGSQGLSVRGSVSVSVIDNETIAEVEPGASRSLTAGSLSIGAEDRAAIYSLGGQLNFGGKAAIGGAVVHNQIFNTTRALLKGDADVAGTAEVRAVSDGVILSLAASGGASQTAALNISFVSSFIGNETTAEVAGDGSTAINAGELKLQARDDSGIYTLAGQISGSGKAAVGAAAAVSDIGNRVRARIDGAGVTVSGALAVEAASAATIGTLAVSAAGGGTVAVSGSVTTNFIHNETVAEICAAGRCVKDGAAPGGGPLAAVNVAGGSVRVQASDASRIESLAGQLAGAGKAAVGAAVAHNQVDNVTRAHVGGVTLSPVTSAQIAAANEGTIRTLSASAGISGAASVDGSVSSNHITNVTEASVIDAGIEGQSADVKVLATDEATIESLSGGVAGAGTGAGVGLAISVNKIGNRTLAHVSGSAAGTRYNVGDLLVRSASQGKITSIAVGLGAVGVGAGVGGSTAVDLIHNETLAFIDAGAAVVSQNNVGVIAWSSETITNAAGVVSFAGKGAGVGLTVTVNEVSGRTAAYIAGESTSVTALATDANKTVEVADGDLEAPDLEALLERALDEGDAPSVDRPAVDLASLRRTTHVRGVAVNASGLQNVQNFSTNVSGAGLGVALNGMTNVNLISGATEAYIAGARINESGGVGSSRQSVYVGASNHALDYSIVAAGTGGLGAAGGAANGASFERSTRAFVEESDAVIARDAVRVSAHASNSSAATVAAGAAGGGAAQATVGVAAFGGDVEAYVASSQLDAGGNVEVVAAQENRLAVKAGVIAVGAAAGLGGAAAVAVSEGDTRAYVDGAEILAGGDVTVEAETETEVTTWAASGSGGVLGVSGSVAVAVAKNTTEAYVTGSTIGQPGRRAGDVTVAAADRITVRSDVGGIAAGLGGALGVAVGVTSVNNTTAAYVDGSNVYAQGDVAVTSHAERDLATLAISGGLGAVGVAGVVAVTLAGSALEDEADSELNRDDAPVLPELDRVAGADRLVTEGDGKTVELDGALRSHEGAPAALDASDLTRVSSVGKTDISGSLYAAPSGSTVAQVRGGSVIDARGDVTVKAEVLDRASIIAGAGAAGLASVGASVGVMNIANKVSAEVVGGSRVRSESGSVVLAARSGRLVAAGDGTERCDEEAAASVCSYQGSGALVAVNAVVAVNKVRNDVTAGAERGAELASGGDFGGVEIKAIDEANVYATARGYQGALAGVGAAVAVAEKNGAVEALIGDENQGGAPTSVRTGGGGLNLTAERTGAVTAHSVAGAGGIVGSGVGSGATATDSGRVRAVIGRDVSVAAGAAQVVVSASAVPQVLAHAGGYSGAIYYGVGASVASASADTTVESVLAQGTSVEAGSLAVRALARLDDDETETVKSFAEAAGVGGLVGVNATESTAKSKSVVRAAIASQLDIEGDVEVTAGNTTRQHADGTGIVGGAVAAGGNVVTSESDSETTAEVTGQAAGTIGGRLVVSAAGGADTYGSAMAGSGGVISGTAAHVYTKDTSATNAFVGSSAGLVARGIEVGASFNTSYNGKVNSINAWVVGGSGAYAEHTVDSDVKAGIRDGSKLTTYDLAVVAKNIARKPELADGEFNATAGAGGVAGGVAVSSSSTVQLDTTVTVGSGADIDVVGNWVNPGRTQFVAVNDVYIRDRAKLDTGGAIAVARSESVADVEASAQVELGEGAAIETVGEATFGTLTLADVETSANSKTYGAAGAAEGTSRSSVAATENVTVHKGVSIHAYGDINLYAGRDAEGKTDAIRAIARTDLFNKTAFPIVTDPDAFGKTSRTALITVAEGASLRSVSDINLLARNGYALSIGEGKGVDSYRALIEQIAEAFRGEDVSVYIDGGRNESTASTGVTVDGLLDAGIYNKQYLVIEQDGTISSQSEGVTVTKTTENLVTNLLDRLRELYELRAAFGLDPQARGAFDAEINYVRQQLIALGYPIEESGTGEWIAESVEVDFLNVGDVLARGGNISVTSDFLAGSGTLKAASDAEIRIENHSPLYLRLGHLAIDEMGGHVYFNGADVTSVEMINQLNAQGSPEARFARIEAAGTTGAKPSITVISTYDPLLQPGAPEKAAGPDIEVTGDITNLVGSVTIENVSGDIIIRGRDGQLSPNITADSISLKAPKGTIAQSYTPGFVHIGGTPDLIWGPEAVESENSGDGERQILTPKPSTGPGWIAGNNVLISARYLNINGTIQSGIPDWELHLREELSGLIGVYKTVWLLRGSKPITSFEELAQYKLTDVERSDGGKIAAYYNPETDQIIVDGVEVRGGYVELYGEIMNTFGGSIKAIDGYGRITITSELPQDLVINTLSTGGNIEGIIRITDTGKMVDGTPLTTVYQRLGDTVYTRQYRGDTLISESTAVGRTASYSPVSGLRYVWKRGQSFTETWVGITTRSEWFDLFPGDDPQTSYDRVEVIARGEPRPLPDGQFTVRDPGSAGYAYTFTRDEWEEGEWVLVNREKWSTCSFITIFGWCVGEREYTVKDTYHQGRQAVYTHSIRADYPIAIEFIGYDEEDPNAVIAVTSRGNILLNGIVSHTGGSVQLVSNGGSIRQIADRAEIVGVDIGLSAGAGIGDDAAVATRLVGSSGALRAEAQGGDINLRALGAEVRVGGIEAAGNVRLDADGAIVGAPTSSPWAISGRQVELVSRFGTIGSSADQPLVVNVGTDDRSGLTASARGNIAIRQAQGDLRLVRVESVAGDVYLETVSGSIVDANRNEKRDERTIEQLERLWSDMRLLEGEGAEESAADTIRAYMNHKKNEYEQYWRLRGVRPEYDADGNLVGFASNPYDPAQADGHPWIDREEYARLHALYGEGTYDPDFEYTLSAEEIETLTEGASWTRTELEYAISESVLFKKTTSTETRIEEPNVKGHNVTLIARGGSVGSDRGEIVITNPDQLKDQDVRIALAAAESDDVAVDMETGVVTILLRDSVDVAATGEILVEGQDHVYLGSREPLYVKAVESAGSIRVKGTQGIFDVSLPGEAAIRGGSTIVEGGDGGIGTSTNPLTVQLQHGAQLIARAAQGIYIHELAGDLNVAQVYGLSGIHLQAKGSILAAGTSPVVIEGREVNLVAETGAIGEESRLVGVIVGGSGVLSATAAQGVYIAGEASVLNLGALNAGGSVVVTSAGDLDLVGHVDAGGDVTLRAARAIAGGDGSTVKVAGRNITLTADQGGIGGAGGTLVVAASGTLDAAAGGDVYLEDRDGDFVSNSLVSRSGSLHLIAQQGALRAGSASAHAALTAHVLGDTSFDTAEAREFALVTGTPGSSAVIGLLKVADQADLAADRVQIDRLDHTGEQLLQMNVVGVWGIAESVAISGQSSVGIAFNRLEAETAVVSADTDVLEFRNTVIGRIAEIQDSRYRVRVDNVNRKLFDVDLQLYAPNYRQFYLLFAPDGTIRTNAYIINFDLRKPQMGLSKEQSATGLVSILLALMDPSRRALGAGAGEGVVQTPDNEVVLSLDEGAGDEDEDEDTPAGEATAVNSPADGEEVDA